jgi:lysophospholipase L1-like esterase
MSAPVSAAPRRPGARVVFYGTSLTHRGGWAETLAYELATQYPSLTAVNAAESGQHSRWGLGNFPSRVLPHKPDLVFMEFAINDAVARFALTPEESRQNLEAMLDLLHAQLPDCAVILQVMNPVLGRPPGHDGHRPNLPGYEQIYREVARERQLLLVDHAPAWAGLLAQGAATFLRFVPDGLHPNQAGYDRFMLPTLRTALGLPSP